LSIYFLSRLFQTISREFRRLVSVDVLRSIQGKPRNTEQPVGPRDKFRNSQTIFRQGGPWALTLLRNLPRQYRSAPNRLSQAWLACPETRSGEVAKAEQTANGA
jgi:hypothetical protein